MKKTTLIYYFLLLMLPIATAQTTDPFKNGAHMGGINDLQLNPQGTLLATAGGDGIVKIWNVKEQKVMHSLSVGRTSCNSVAFSSDSKYLFAAGNSHICKIEVQSGTILRQAEVEGYTPSICISRNQQLLAIATWNGLVQILDTDSLKLRYTFPKNEPFLTAIAFASDSKSIFIPDRDHMIQQIELKTGAILQTIELSGDALIMNMAISADNHWLAVQDKSVPITLFDLTQTEQKSVIVPNSKLSSMFSPSNTRFYFDSNQNNLIFVDEKNQLAQYQCSTQQVQTYGKIQTAYFKYHKASEKVYGAEGSSVYELNLGDLQTRIPYGKRLLSLDGAHFHASEPAITIFLNKGQRLKCRWEPLQYTMLPKSEHPPFERSFLSNKIKTDDHNKYIFLFDPNWSMVHQSQATPYKSLVNLRLNPWGVPQPWQNATHERIFCFDGEQKGIIYQGRLDTTIQLQRSGLLWMELLEAENQVLLVYNSNKIVIFDYIHQKVVSEQQLQSVSTFRKIALSTDERQLALSDGSSISIFNLADGKLKHQYPLPEAFQRMSYVDAQRLLIGYNTFNYELLNTTSLQKRAFNPDIYPTDWTFSTAKNRCLIENYNVGAMKWLRFEGDSVRVDDLSSKIPGKLSFTDVSPAGRWMLFGSNETLFLYDTEAKMMMYQWQFMQDKEQFVIRCTDSKGVSYVKVF
jgi:WD40 repeat protein